MARRIGLTVPAPIERTILSRMQAQGAAADKQGAFGYALLDYIRELEIRIAILERAAASGSTPAAPAPKAAEDQPAEDWGTNQW